jgi:hypothetical protein
MYIYIYMLQYVGQINKIKISKVGSVEVFIGCIHCYWIPVLLTSIGVVYIFSALGCGMIRQSKKFRAL